MNRGDRGEEIFFGDDDRERFLGPLEEVCLRADWQVHAFCLMGNHFHMVLETPLPTLVSGMKWMLGTYTQRFNARHRLRGHLFAGRYKALSVDESDAFYLRTVCDYVHLNPVRARVRAADRHESAFVRESMASRADRIVGEELASARLEPRSLEVLPKGAPIKIRIARRLRESTTLTLKEISALLHAGAWRSLANALSKPDVSI